MIVVPEEHDRTAEPPPLRLGVLAPGLRLARWQRRVLEHLQAGGDTELVAVVIDRSPAPAHDLRSRLHRLVGRRGLWQLYNNMWVARRATALRRVDCDDILGGLPVIDVLPDRVGRYSQHFPTAALDALGPLDLDILLRFGFGILRGPVLSSARQGVWSFHHDDERVIRGGPPSFWEVADELPTTGVLLQRLTDALDAGIPLARATFRTVAYSYPRNRDRAALGAAVLPAKVARAVRFGQQSTAIEPSATDAPLRRDPSNGAMLSFLARQSVRAVSSRFKGITRGQKWGIGLVEHGAFDSASRAVDRVEWLPPFRHNGYLADPFPVVRDGRIAILAEEFDERRARGVISAVARDAGGGWRLHSGVICPGVHASYPCVFAVDGELYCAPETWQSGRVDAWRCTRFPDRWEHHATLLSGVALADPTIFQWSGQWWLLGVRKDRDSDTELWAWHAPGPFGTWTPHAANPLKIDVTSSRPAGTPFVRDGALFRPAQDGSQGYGAALSINRVDRLDEVGFSEQVVERVELLAGPYPHGPHTFVARDGHVCIDGFRLVTDRHRLRRELSGRIQRRRTGRSR